MWWTALALGVWVGGPGSGQARAHPFDAKFYGHRLQVRVSPVRVQVTYLAEVPTPTVIRELRAELADVAAPGQADQDAFTERALEELETGLRLYAGDERIRWRRLPMTGDNGVGDARFILYQLDLEAELPQDTRTINLVNANHPDRRAIFLTEVLLHRDLRLEQSSMITLVDGEVVADRQGQWRMEEDQRELRLSFGSRSDWDRAVLDWGLGEWGDVAPDDAGFLPAAAARAPAPRWPWAVGGGLLLVLLGIGGGLLWRRRPPPAAG